MADDVLTNLASLGSLSADDILYVVDDPAISKTHHKTTAATILASLGGGASCVTHTCGAVGWRASGGTISRTLVHEDAFQLTTAGNTRGDYAIDLQQVQGAATHVAGGDWSAIYGGRNNSINCDPSWGWFCGIVGSYNTIEDETDQCWIFGYDNYLHGTVDGCYQAVVCAVGTDLDNAEYHSVFGVNHVLDQAFGCTVFMEGNTLTHVIGDELEYPIYCVSIGYSNTQIGDTFECFQFGDQNWLEGTGSSNVWLSHQFGENCQIYNAQVNFQFGVDCLSYQTSNSDGYDGRITFSGDYANDYFTTPAGVGSGYNQDSWFSDNDLITTWPSSWTSSIFQYKILTDSIWYFVAYISGTEVGCANSYSWKIEGLIENDGGTTTILNSSVTNVYRDVVTKEWQVVADDANDRLVFQYRDTAGPDATNCNIQFSMFTVETGYTL
jgi:hypothetical protein